MVIRFVGPSPGDPSDFLGRLHQSEMFWEQLEIGGDPGETTWEELDSLRAQYNEALKAVPMDLEKAESLTAYAALLMCGLEVF